MITELLASFFGFLIDGFLSLVDYVIPPPLDAAWSQGLGLFGSVFSFVPAAAFGYLLISWLAFDTALNTYEFAVNTYRLFPGKFT